jgi:two-component system alkaline phosphatase synthesis response regulator PhoP
MKLQTLKLTMPSGDLNVADRSESQFPTPKRRILVADDQEGIRQLISSILTDAGFEVGTAADGLEAWEALLCQHYDLLITDNEMPRLTGIELIKRMGWAGMVTPVIVASGVLSEGNVSGNLRNQIAALLRKPFGMFELLTAVRHTLGASSGAANLDHRTLLHFHARPRLN